MGGVLRERERGVCGEREREAERDREREREIAPCWREQV